MGGITNIIQSKNIRTVYLHAGHGGKDVGAVWGKNVERDQAIWLVDRIAQLLKGHENFKGFRVVVAPHNLDTHQSVPWINQRVKRLNDAIAIEIHRDSFPNINPTQAKKRLGVYFGNSGASQEVAEQIERIWESNGAVQQTWSRSHKSANFGSLYAITKPNCWAWLFELGFVQGGFENREWLANQGARAILEVMTGKDYDSKPKPKPAPLPKLELTNITPVDMIAIESAELKDIRTGKVKRTYPKGTTFAITRKAKYGNKIYYITKYSAINNINNGFDVDQLSSKPPEPTELEKLTLENKRINDELLKNKDELEKFKLKSNLLEKNINELLDINTDLHQEIASLEKLNNNYKTANKNLLNKLVIQDLLKTKNPIKWLREYVRQYKS